MPFSTIDEALSSFEDHIQKIGSDRKYVVAIDKIVRTVQMNAISNHEKGYCLKFFTGESLVLDLLNNSPINVKDLSNVFIKIWGIPSSDAKMYGSSFYHVLLFFILYGIRNNNEKIAKDALNLLLFRIWNGRLHTYITYCDEDTMTYVISNMMNKQFLSSKYETPLELVTNYMCPTILEKYKGNVKSDSRETKRILDASWARIRQLFVSGKIPNLKTGEVSYSSGIAPLYYKAKEQNLKFSTLKLSSIKDNEMSSAVDALSSNVFADQIESINNYIVTNTHPSYPNEIISYINEKTKLKSDVIDNILKKIHIPKYKDHIHELLELMFKRLTLNSKNEVCNNSFMDTMVKTKIISSKHTADVIQLKKIIDDLLEKILMNDIKPAVNYHEFNDSNQSQFRNLIIYGISYNIQQFICHS